MIRSRKAHESGVALVAALGVIVVVGIIAAFVCKVAVVSNQVTSSQGRSLVSYNLAISALTSNSIAFLTMASPLRKENVFRDRIAQSELDRLLRVHVVVKRRRLVDLFDSLAGVLGEYPVRDLARL